jgi:hypothetical protein
MLMLMLMLMVMVMVRKLYGDKKISDTEVDTQNGTVRKPRKYVALQLSKVTPCKISIFQFCKVKYGDHLVNPKK